MRHAWFIVIFVLFAVAITDCAEVPMPSSLRQSPSCPLNLGPEDVVTIRVFGETDLTGDYQADNQGNLDFPFVGRMNIKGQTNTSLADRIASQLRDGDYILEPQVSVVIKEHNSARILIDGKVTRPGALPFRTGMTLLEAISQAGGREPLADRRVVRLTRSTGEGTKTENVPVQAIYDGRQADIRLCPGDSIYVPESVL